MHRSTCNAEGPRGRKAGARWLALLVVCSIGGCADETAVMVEVRSSELEVGRDVDALRFAAFGESGFDVKGTYTVEEGWPHSVAIRPGKGRQDEAVTIVVTAMRERRFVVRRVVESRFRSGRTVRVEVRLTKACVGMRCPERVDCVDGRCETEDGDMDGGLDGGSDAGGDAGRDGRTKDAGVRDADASGPDDVDACVPLDNELCNGLDDDCDSHVDEGPRCNVVLSELATGGPNGSSDEFVELYNRGERRVDIGGVRIEYRSASGDVFRRRATMPEDTRIRGHGFYLAANEAYGRATPPDLPDAWSTGFSASGGHVRLIRGGIEIDRLGWGGAAAPEGDAQDALEDDRTSSYERKAVEDSTAERMLPGGRDAERGNGYDADDNATDFLHREAPQPQNADSGTEAP